MSMAHRIARLRQKMAQENYDAFLVGSPENRNYLSGFGGSAGWLFITPTQTVLATDFRYIERAGHDAPDYQVVRISGALDWLTKLVGDSGARRIAFEADKVTFSTYQALQNALKPIEPARELVATNAFIDQIRAVKDAREVELLTKAVLIADRAIEQVIEKMRPGMTEKEVAWQVELRMRELGADAISFDTIVASGPHGAIPHHSPTDRRIEKNDPVTIDMGAKYNGYCSDITRTAVVGKPSAEFRRVYDIVLAAQETTEATVRNGITGGDVDQIARDIIDKAGHAEHFGHSLGHGIGLAVHEYPRVGPKATSVIEDNMVFTVEPGIYITGWGGIRIEDMGVMENGKMRVLTTAHKRDLVLV